MGGVHYLLQRHAHRTALATSAGAARILTLAGVMSAAFLVIVGRPFIVWSYSDTLAAVLLVAGIVLTAYVLDIAGPLAIGVLIGFSMLVAFALDVLFRNAVLDWPTTLSVIGLEIMTYLTAFFFGRANS